MIDERIAAVADLLRRTGAAHHRAFLATNGEDADWPSWYAEHARLEMGRLLGREFSAAGLTNDFAALDAEHRARGAGEEWPRFYAGRLVERYGVAAAGG